MSRHDRLAQRLRGAGRVNVNNSPVAFRAKTPKSKSSGVAPTRTAKTPGRSPNGLDVLVPLTSSSMNTSGKKAIKAKMMDFSTPKMARKRKSSFASTKKVHNNIPSQVEQTTVEAASNRPLSSSTPEHVTRVIDGSPCALEPIDTASPIVCIDSVETGLASLSAADIIVEAENNERHDSPVSARKRKLQDTDMQIPVIMSPAKKPKKKLRGLLRELGPGASRFIIGAPNFATPARPKMIESPKDHTRVRRVYLRKSHRITKANESLSLLDVPSLITTKPKLAAVKKACRDCHGTRAWNRWHATSDGDWRCNKCQNSRSSNRKSASARKTISRIGISLTDDEHVLVVVRRQQGHSYDAIAKELNKWKTGQSVRKYLEKPGSKSRTRDLAGLVEAALKKNNLPTVLAQDRTRKKAAKQRRRPAARVVVQHSLQAGIASCDPDESDIFA